MARSQSPATRPPLTSRHKSLREVWARTYMKLYIQYLIFSNETRATVDGWTGEQNDGYANRTNAINDSRRQQGEGSVVIGARTVGNEMIDTIKVPEGAKIIAATYCDMLVFVLHPWLEDLPLTLRRQLV